MKHKEHKERNSFTLLYSAVVFCIQLISLLVAAVLVFVLNRMNIFMSFTGENITVLLVFMITVSIIIGVVITLLTRKIPLTPFNELIDNMNRLAAGDFNARLTFSDSLRNHPTFSEVTDSFNKMAQELENTEMLRRDFINNFSHEFKTPIVSIAGFAKLLRRGNPTAQQREEYLEIIEEESLRLAAMASNVLNLTKIENQTILTNISTFNLSEQLRSCVLLLEDSWSKKNLSLDLEFDEYSVTANEELLKQVWINLIDNAVKFTPPTGEIAIRIGKTDTAVKVTITNFGSEIPSDKLDKIWTKFYQVDESHTTVGNGIGLAVVKYITELHRGRVSAESADGVTSFSVELPAVS